MSDTVTIASITFIAQSHREKNMNNQPTPPQAMEIETLKQTYAALNRGDVDGFTSIFDADIERIEFAGTPQSGTYRGLEAVKAHVARARGTWAEGSCEPQRFIAAGDRIVVLVHVCVKLKNEDQWREGRVADVFTFRNGKAIQFRTFADQAEAMEWAGVRSEASDAR